MLPTSTVGNVGQVAGNAAKTEKAKQTGVEFEAVFLAQILKTMSEGLSPDGMLGKEPFGSMLMDEYAKLLSRTGGVGIADSVMKELLTAQEKSQ